MDQIRLPLLTLEFLSPEAGLDSLNAGRGDEFCADVNLLRIEGVPVAARQIKLDLLDSMSHGGQRRIDGLYRDWLRLLLRQSGKTCGEDCQDEGRGLGKTPVTGSNPTSHDHTPFLFASGSSVFVPDAIFTHIA
jgi:hypothetical protein